MEFKRRRYNHSYLNIAPLVDVVFLLLLFFMLTSHLVQEPAISVKLPRSKTASMLKQSVPTVVINREGKIYFDAHEVSLTSLTDIIKKQLSERKIKKIRIKADRDIQLSLLIKVIDQIRLAGISDFGIITNKEQ